MPDTWKTVRVFIFSTFRDMQAERDHLVNVVFQELHGRVEQLRQNAESKDKRADP